MSIPSHALRINVAELTEGLSVGSQEDDMTPVDLDMNLVQNLLSSYQAQEGMAGPTSNLAGMLGLQL